ncbi:Zinc-binding alcohol dehydrogenase domain-containing protein 2 [Ananas comosus]|uniref:Zinc-binding alcohol dehydrogenase domain-containing protein 2 n=1 Tax=Ananas comosus TaxID=4615 RepID=A0A199V2K3_ANACO|nr:Zinc-binding alcohol dehydrogenase domain-containing protein 2 [Ananas comosus]
MELKPGMSALVTGGASGIGRALSLALARKGLFVTIVDYSEENGKEVACLVEKENMNFHANLNFPSALFVKCDVTNSGDIAAAFEKHMETYGGLDICINSAGIGNTTLFYEDRSDGTATWRHTVNVNLVAVIDCTRIAMLMVASSPTNCGVVLFTRSLAPLKRVGIRVNVLCPEFVQTELASKINPKLIDAIGGFLSMEDVVQGAFELIKDESKAGACLWITRRRGMEYWPTPMEERKYLIDPFKSQRKFTHSNFSNIKIPHSFEKIVVHTLTHDFRSATRIVRTQLRLPIEPQHALVKIIYAGVNASDVNFSSGRYFSGNAKEVASRLPFDAGFEAVGIVAAVGDSVTHVKVGTPVALMTFGNYAEFTLAPAKHLLPVPRPAPEVVAMLTSGLTASIALERAGQMASGQVALVTAAAGGTGQFAVQLAKLAGNKVVATCGGERKAALLKSFGVDRVIDYRKEKIKDVLKKEYPKGVDIIYESVGGEMFDICLNALAVHGRLIVIGMISQYQGEHGWKPLNYTGLCEKILAKSQTVAGFFLVQYAHLWQEHLDRLFDLFNSGKLKVAVDPKKFLGVASVADAVEYLHSGKSLGKVVVCIDPTFSQKPSKL